MQIAQLIADIATAFTLIVGIVIFAWQIRTKWKEDKYRHSSFALDFALKAYNDSYSFYPMETTTELLG